MNVQKLLKEKKDFFRNIDGLNYNNAIKILKDEIQELDDIISNRNKYTGDFRAAADKERTRKQVESSALHSLIREKEGK